MRSGDEVHIAGRRIGLNVDSRRQGGALPRDEGIVKTHRFGPVQYPKPGLRALKDDIFVDQVQSELAGKNLVAQTDGQQWFSDAHEFVDGDRKSTRLNSSHVAISYAVFCLKKKTPVCAVHETTTAR